MTHGAEFQPESAIRLFARHDVRYVLIGGLAAITHGAPLITQDIDVCYARGTDDLRRMADALAEVHAELRGANPVLPLRLDARTLRAGDSFTFTTDVGWLDLLGTPSGTTGYEDLAQTADVFMLFGQRVLVASVEDLIRMKRAAGRPKDILGLEESALSARNWAGNGVKCVSSCWISATNEAGSTRRRTAAPHRTAPIGSFFKQLPTVD